MNPELSLIPILYLLGAGQGAFLALALFSSKLGSRVANRYLGALTLVFSLALIDYFLDITGLRVQYIQIRTLLWPKEFLYGTLIYFYVRELVQPGVYPLKGIQWLHFLPTAAHLLVAWSVLFLSASRQQAILNDKASSNMADTVLAWLLGDFELFTVIAQLTIYLLLSLRLLNQHSRRIKETFSYTEKISLNWLRMLLVGIFMVYLIWLIEELLSEWLKLEEIFDILLGTSMVALIYTMGYLGLRQPVIFTRQTASKNNAEAEYEPVFAGAVSGDSIIESSPNAGKYKNSPLSPDLSQALMKELQTFMQKDKPFLDNKLSLPQLAGQLGVSPNYLSQTINEQMSRNFFDFINSYRIEEAKLRLTNHQQENENILGIAMDAGFNSKSAFYTAFKKHIDMTPGMYRKSLAPHQNEYSKLE